MAELKDSGARRNFDTGATRDISDGKGRCDLLPLDTVENLMERYRDWVEFRLATTKTLPSILQSIDLFIQFGDICDLYVAACRYIDLHYKCDICTALLELSIHFEDGARKYSANNWKKGIPVQCYIDSAIRHYLKLIYGWEDEPHDRAVLWNIMCAMWTAENIPQLNEYAQTEESK